MVKCNSFRRIQNPNLNSPPYNPLIDQPYNDTHHTHYKLYSSHTCMVCMYKIMRPFCIWYVLYQTSTYTQAHHMHIIQTCTWSKKVMYMYKPTTSAETLSSSGTISSNLSISCKKWIIKWSPKCFRKCIHVHVLYMYFQFQYSIIFKLATNINKNFTSLYTSSISVQPCKRDQISRRSA